MTIPTGGGAVVHGDLTIVREPTGVVVFAHGSGSSRHSSRNRYVAGLLQDCHLATLLTDLLTTDEEAADVRTAHLRFDIELLAARLVDAIDWVESDDDLNGLPRGLFGASTGAAAALVAAARRPDGVAAVVSRGGRPDLARDQLGAVRAPTLLIVGGHDEQVLALNRTAMQQLDAENRLEVVPGATHLFEETGALDRVASLTGDWFTTAFRQPTATRRQLR
ncbi:MAG: dienelactone hydrolase family protein [Acidimicrobiales bacterium]